MRVLWVVKGLGPGGAERLLCAAARAHDGHRYEIDCAFVLPWKDHLVGELEAAGVRTQCLSTTRSDPRWPVRLARLITHGNYDVIHVHSPLPGSVARFVARTMRKSACPGMVSTEHNRWETHRFPTRLVNRLTSRWDDASFAVTDEVRESMRGPALARTKTLRHGIEVEHAAEERAHRSAIRDELGIEPSEIVIGTVANFRPQKDYPNLFQAARLLADRNVPVRIVAVGQGPQETELEALHSELNLGERVILTGFRDDAVRVMAACDAFTLASKWEGLPVAVMEALALGLPIVATNVGGMAEELHNEVDALLVPPHDANALADAIERVATDSALRQRLGEAAGALAPNFSVARTVTDLEATYEHVARVRTSEPQPGDPAQAPGQSDLPPVGPADSRQAVAKPALHPPLEIRAATPEDRGSIIELLQRSLGSDGDPRYPQLFAWKHDENRFGRSPMWVATDDERVVAFRTLMRWEFVRGGRVLRAVRAVDTATDPDYQGRGLFRRLTMHALAEVEAEKVDFVFNTPNGQSRPGYLKMGWREVGRLPTAVHFVGPMAAARALRSRVPADRWSTALPDGVGVPVDQWLTTGCAGDDPSSRLAPPVDVRELRTNIDAQYLRWRFGMPHLAYRAVVDGDEAIIVRARKRGDSIELAVVARFGDPDATDRLAARTARDAGCTYAIRLGSPNLAAGFFPLPGNGPILTWRAVKDQGLPPLSNWGLTLGDIELF